MTFIKILKDFLTYIVRSILFSVVISIVSLSLLTQQFPPDLKKIRAFYIGYQQLRKISSAMAAQSDTVSSDDGDLEKLVSERKQLSEILTKLNLTEPAKTSIEPTDSISCDRQVATIDQLKEKIRVLDEANNDLNKQVLQLKYK